ncbi:hypothetical protein [Streptomyces aquilus]
MAQRQGALHVKDFEGQELLMYSPVEAVRRRTNDAPALHALLRRLRERIP